VLLRGRLVGTLEVDVPESSRSCALGKVRALMGRAGRATISGVQSFDHSAGGVVFGKLPKTGRM
jgi:hypothetical protein